MPSRDLWKAAIVVPADQVATTQDALGELFAESVAISAFRTEDSDHWVVEALIDHKPDLQAVADALRGAGATDITVEPVPDADWVAESRKSMKPVHQGRFHIYPLHRARERPAGGISILIDPGLAFGTGSHQSTRGCLMALEHLARSRRPRRLLDIGCGSGILSIAMAKLWPAQILACDIDPLACEVTRANADLNGVGGAIRTVLADGPGHRAITAKAPFDLIMANILARPLRKMAPRIARRLAAPGTLVLSGLLASQEAEVRSAYVLQGLKLDRRIVVGEWHSLLMIRQ